MGCHVTSRNQGLSSNDKGRQRRETLGTRLKIIESSCKKIGTNGWCPFAGTKSQATKRLKAPERRLMKNPLPCPGVQQANMGDE